MWRLLLPLLSFKLAQAASQCYYPNGTTGLDSSNYQVCDPTAEFSSCCGIGDECLTNGLCRANASAANSNDYWRDLCTDPTWESDACPKFCYNSTTSPTAADGTYFVEACSDTTWCCGNLDVWRLGNWFECCDDPSVVFDGGRGERLTGAKVFTQPIESIKSTTRSAISSTSYSSSTAVTSTSTTTSHTASYTSPIPTPDPGLSVGAKAGIGVGTGVAVILIIAAFFAGIFLRRKRKRNHEEVPSKAHDSWYAQYTQPNHPSPYAPSPAPAYSPHGAGGIAFQPMQEMDDNMISEMSSRHEKPVEIGTPKEELSEMEGCSQQGKARQA